jgi:hypothetical protein
MLSKEKYDYSRDWAKKNRPTNQWLENLTNISLLIQIEISLVAWEGQMT